MGDTKARTLGYDHVIGFFNALERVEYPLYSFKPRHVMEAWQQYATAAHRLQDKMKAEAESAQREKEEEEHRKQCITFDEFKRRQANNKQ